MKALKSKDCGNNSPCPKKSLEMILGTERLSADIVLLLGRNASEKFEEESQAV